MTFIHPEYLVETDVKGLDWMPEAQNYCIFRLGGNAIQ